MSYYTIAFQNNTTGTLLIKTNGRLIMFTNRANALLLLYLSKLLHLFFSLRDLSSAYNHKNTTGIPIAKKMIIVRTGTRKVNNAKPKITAPMPRAASQRFVRLSAFKFKPLFQPLYLLYVGSLFILNISIVIRFSVT